MILDEQRGLREQFAEHADESWLYFFALFGRFEYAMKEVGWLVQGRRRPFAEWDDVARILSDEFWERFRNCAATAVLFDEPARERELVNGQAVWPDVPPRPPSDNVSLFRGLKKIRNNLFHGDKSVGRERDQALVAAGVAILDETWSMIRDTPDAQGFRFAFLGAPNNG
ncbi:MAG: hypothetical protein AB8B85_20335 [Paracoccaceae bacterium]